MEKGQKQEQKEWYKSDRARCSLNLVDENNTVHLSRLKELLPDQPEGKILEVGCGSGWYSGSFGPSVVLDISYESVCRVKAAKARVVGDVENLPFKNGAFDFVYGFGIIHHLENIPKGFGDLNRVLKQKGRVAFGAENSALCPMNYLFPFIYGNWKIEKGFMRISAKKIGAVMKAGRFSGFSYVYGGFAVYGLTSSVYKVTKILEGFISRLGFFKKYAGFLYFTAVKD